MEKFPAINGGKKFRHRAFEIPQLHSSLIPINLLNIIVLYSFNIHLNTILHKRISDHINQIQFCVLFAMGATCTTPSARFDLMPSSKFREQQKL
jgi:hypothetical protein